MPRITITIDTDSDLYRLAEEYCNILNANPGRRIKWDIEDAIKNTSEFYLKQTVQNLK